MIHTSLSKRFSRGSLVFEVVNDAGCYFTGNSLWWVVSTFPLIIFAMIKIKVLSLTLDRTKHAPEKIEFRYREELGKQLERFNGATRVNVLANEKDSYGFDIASTSELAKLTTVISQMRRERGILPSFGLKIKYHSRQSFVVPFVLEFGKDNNFGLYFLLAKKPISVQKIQQIEKTIKLTSLKGAFIVSNNIGNSAIREVKRINSMYDRPVLFLEHYGSMENRFKLNIFAP